VFEIARIWMRREKREFRCELNRRFSAQIENFKAVKMSPRSFESDKNWRRYRAPKLGCHIKCGEAEILGCGDSGLSRAMKMIEE
jgi:hypothetical protein